MGRELPKKKLKRKGKVGRKKPGKVSGGVEGNEGEKLKQWTEWMGGRKSPVL